MATKRAPAATQAPAKKARSSSARTRDITLTVYRSKAIGSNYSVKGDFVCEIGDNGDLLIKQRSNGAPIAAFAHGQWATVNAEPI